jgi:O-antigen/teichoic acid export membrane protein
MAWTKQVFVKGLIGRWKSDPGFWSLADQGSVSAGNFVTTVLLARALTPSEYGIYALLFALMQFMYSLHAAVILYGLSLHGASGTDAALRPLAGGSLVLTMGLGTVLGAATGAVAILFNQSRLVPWILLAFLSWQLQEATRRALMSRLRHRDAVWGDALSYLGQALLIAYVFVGHRLTLAFAFQAMAATSAVAWAFQMAQLKLTFSDFYGASRLVPKFWDAGRWALLAKIAEAFIGQALLCLLGFGGMIKVASFQSVLNLLRVTNPVMFAIGSVVLPSVAAQKESAAGLRAVRRYSLVGGLVLLPYYAVILAFPAMALRWIYGAGSPYAKLGLELRVLVLGCVFAYVAHILTMFYFGLSRSDVALRCELIAAAVTVVAGVVLVTEAGVLGAAVAYDLTFAVLVGAFAWFLGHRTPAALETSKSVKRASIEGTSEASR